MFGAGEGDHFGSVAGLGDDGQVRFGVEDQAGVSAYEGVVVGQQARAPAAVRTRTTGH